MKFLELDDWKHYHVWEDYISAVEGKIPDECLEMLRMLQIGRPLKGKSIDHDGCCYAWLTADEVKTLFAALKKVKKAEVDDGDCLDMFHEEVVDSLKIAYKAGHAIFLAAH